MFLVRCKYVILYEDTYYNVKYEYETGTMKPGWYVDHEFITPMVDGLGSKMYGMAVNVLQVWLNAKHLADGKPAFYKP